MLKTHMNFTSQPKKILILSYSFSGQTSNLLRGLEKGLRRKGYTVNREKLEPIEKLKFPTSGFYMCLKMMVRTFFRCRVPIQELSIKRVAEHELIILAGPTWSYNPSGPILSLIDRDGKRLFNQKKILPLISCRGYWRLHWYGLRSLLKRCGATVYQPIIFSHPTKEPWRTIGVFCKIAGKNPERSYLLGKLYKKFGHSRSQQTEAERFGHLIGDALHKNISLDEINFRTKKAIP